MKQVDLPQAIHEIIPSVASVLHRKYRSYVDKDDLIQEAYAWAYPKSASITDQLMQEDPEELKRAERALGWQIKRVLERYCRKEKAQKSGYQVADEAYYEEYTLGQLLPHVIKAIIYDLPFENAQVTVDDGQPRRPSAPAESGNLIATLIDIKQGYLKLEPGDQSLLTQRYYHEWTLQQIANHWECAVSTADRRCEVALRRLQDKLGGATPWA